MKFQQVQSLIVAVALSVASAASTRGDEVERKTKLSRQLKSNKSSPKGKQSKKCKKALKSIPTNEADFGEPAWENIIELAFPPWTISGECGSLTAVGSGVTNVPVPTVVGSQEGKWNPCYYTKRFAGLDPSLGGYPTPIDTKYPYEFAAPFFGQPGDGSVHHCPVNSANNIGIPSCPKLGTDCGPDCTNITQAYGIGHIPPFVPLAAIVNEYQSCGSDVCGDWFDYETNGCSIKKSTLDELVYKYFGDGNTIKFQPPILLDGQPSNTYFRLEYGGEGCGDPNVACKGPHYCTAAVGDTAAWGDFCPYVHVGQNSGKYRHPHIALAALETWIANQCMPTQCDSKWLGNNNDYPPTQATSITWAEMANNADSMSQPKVPYEWPIATGNTPGCDLYPNGACTGIKPVAGSYVTEFVAAL